MDIDKLAMKIKGWVWLDESSKRIENKLRKLCEPEIDFDKVVHGFKLSKKLAIEERKREEKIGIKIKELIKLLK